MPYNPASDLPFHVQDSNGVFLAACKDLPSAATIAAAIYVHDGVNLQVEAADGEILVWLGPEPVGEPLAMAVTASAETPGEATLTFTGTDLDGTVDFGDGTQAPLAAEVTHAYAATGSFEVVAGNSSGETARAWVTGAPPSTPEQRLPEPHPAYEEV